MPEDWNAIAAEVEEAIRSVGDVSQPDGYPATICRMVLGTLDPETPWIPADPVPAYTTVRVLVFEQELRDINGTLIDQTRRTVTISGAAGIVPTDDDTIAEGIEAEAASDSSAWQTILAVRSLAPVGIAVLYELDLAT